MGNPFMEMVEIVATSNFINNRVGSITRKDRLRVPENLANELIKIGVAKLNPMMAVCRNIPSKIVPPVDGGDKLPSSLQAAQASPKKIAILLQASPVGSASQSMILSNDCRVPMSSTLAMEHGGEFTTKKLKKNLSGKDGLKTKKRPINLDSDESVVKTNPDSEQRESSIKAEMVDINPST